VALAQETADTESASSVTEDDAESTRSGELGRTPRSSNCEKKCRGKDRLRRHPLFQYTNPVLDWVVWGAMFIVTYIVFLLIFAMMVKRGHNPLSVASGCFAMTLVFAAIEAALVFGYQSVEVVDKKCWCTVWSDTSGLAIMKAVRWEIWGAVLGGTAVVALLLWLTFRNRDRH